MSDFFERPMTRVQAAVVQVLAEALAIKVLGLGVLVGVLLVAPVAVIPILLSSRHFLKMCGTTPLSRISKALMG